MKSITCEIIKKLKESHATNKEQTEIIKLLCEFNDANGERRGEYMDRIKELERENIALKTVNKK